MMTKQQALEFIYELYNQTTVYINLEKGKMYADVYVDYEEGITGTYTADIGFKPQSNKGNLLEELVTEFIKVNQDSNLLNNFDKIPVDVDMLEVGQTYEIEYDNYGEIDKIVDKLTKITIDEYRNNRRTLHFDRYCSITEGLIIEIYKENECIN